MDKGIRDSEWVGGLLRFTVLTSRGTRAGLTPPAGFTRWRRERQDAREKEKDKMTQLSGMGRGSQECPLESPHLGGGEAGAGKQGQDGNLDLQQVLCLLGPRSPSLYSGDEQGYYLPPHFADEETEVRSKLSSNGAHRPWPPHCGAPGANVMREFTANPPLCVKGGGHKGHPEEWESPREQLSGDPRRQSYASIQKLSLLRTLEKISFMPWEECMPLANAETEPEKRGASCSRSHSEP